MNNVKSLPLSVHIIVWAVLVSYFPDFAIITLEYFEDTIAIYLSFTGQ